MSTKCGPGSTAPNTVNLRGFLKQIINDFDIVNVVDFGCGDLYWITLDPWDFNYVGIDDNIRLEAKRRADENAWELIEFDLTSVPEFIGFDLTICKDVLRHHDNSAISKIISNMRSKYLLADYDDKTLVSGDHHRKVEDYCLVANKVDLRDWLGEPIASIESNELPTKRFGLWELESTS